MPFDSTSFQTETKPEVLEPWRQVLLDAADLIDRAGWSNCTLEDAGGGRCVIGAIRYVMTGTVELQHINNDANTWAVIKRFGDYLGDRVTQHTMSDRYAAADWNNTPGRTKEEVLTALRECARS